VHVHVPKRSSASWPTLKGQAAAEHSGWQSALDSSSLPLALAVTASEPEVTGSASQTCQCQCHWHSASGRTTVRWVPVPLLVDPPPQVQGLSMPVILLNALFVLFPPLGRTRTPLQCMGYRYLVKNHVVLFRYEDTVDAIAVVCSVSSKVRLL
jgi:hypothetical protein